MRRPVVVWRLAEKISRRSRGRRPRGCWSTVNGRSGARSCAPPTRSNRWLRSCRQLAQRQRLIAVRAGHQYLAGTPIKSGEPRGKSTPGWKAVQVAQQELNRDCGHLANDLTEEANDLEEHLAELAWAQALIAPSAGTVELVLPKGDPAEIAALLANAVRLEQAAERLSAEPAGRALSPIVYVPERDVYVLFGGDHLDYLTNDLWIFDAKSQRWRELNSKLAPAPRANHKLSINAAGALVLSGGYQYRLNTDYLGTQYQEVTDGDWMYDWQRNQWSPADQQPVGDRLVPAAGRTYRGGPFHPDYYLGGEQPNASAFATRLAELKPNAWTSTQPPLLPQLNRDWGSAVIDPDHDLILRFSGGHSAHGGSDVLQYHLGSNRWELPFPVEFPLGQLYSNTEYPEGINLNQRPWVTGHTYQSYAYDANKHQMLFTGRLTHTYCYSPEVQDWTGRFAKPPGMVYDSCFYTLTMTGGSQGVFVWTARGDVFRLDSAAQRWVEVEQHGEHLPGAEVDNSTVVEDTRRHRLLFVRKPYGDQAKFNGLIYTLDLADGSTGRLQPQGAAAAAAIPYLCQLRYDPEHDLVLAGAIAGAAQWPPPYAGIRLWSEPLGVAGVVGRQPARRAGPQRLAGDGV